MSWVTIGFSVIAGSCLSFAAVHLMVWSQVRHQWENLLFSVAAVSAAAMALLELQMMLAHSPDEFASRLQWLHVPTGILVVAVTWFALFYLKSGRAWIAWSITVLRGVVLVLNFADPPNATFAEISGLKTVSFMGEVLSVPIGLESPWRILIHLSTILLFVHILDAGIGARRTGTRRHALLLSGVIGYAIVQSVVFATLMAKGVLPGPFLSLAFFAIVAVMAYELSADILRVNVMTGELMASRDRTRLAARVAELVIWEWDAATRRIWFADSTRPRANIAGEDRIDLEAFLRQVHTDDREATGNAIRHALEAGGDVRIEHRMVDEGGSIRWIATEASVELGPSNEPRLVRGVSRDITERKQVEKDLERHRVELLHVQRVAAVEHLSSTVAHELSQPLGAILRNADAAELLLDKVPPDVDEIRTIVDDIRRDDLRAASVIEQFKALLKKREPTFQLVDVSDLINEVSTLLNSELQARGIVVTEEIASATPKVNVDRVHFQQVLINLILNAIDALEDVPANERRLQIRAIPHGTDAVEFSVSDSGPGIPPEISTALFESFASSKQEGLGLGLAISRTIVELHGGEISLENMPEGGAIARFTVKTAEH